MAYCNVPVVAKMNLLSLVISCSIMLSILSAVYSWKSGMTRVLPTVFRHKVAAKITVRLSRLTTTRSLHCMDECPRVSNIRHVDTALFMSDGGGEDSEDPLLWLMEEGRDLVSSATKNNQIRRRPSADNNSNYDENTGDIASEEVAELIMKRMAHRFEKNFAAADLVRDELLFSHQVTLYDRLGIWKSVDGRSGSIKGYSERYNDKVFPAAPVSCTLSAEQIDQLVQQRTHLRRKRMFTEADKIRDVLAVNGVELMDASNEWRTYDGSLSGMQSSDW